MYLPFFRLRVQGLVSLDRQSSRRQFIGDGLNEKIPLALCGYYVVSAWGNFLSRVRTVIEGKWIYWERTMCPNWRKAGTFLNAYASSLRIFYFPYSELHSIAPMARSTSVSSIGVHVGFLKIMLSVSSIHGLWLLFSSIKKRGFLGKLPINHLLQIILVSLFFIVHSWCDRPYLETIFFYLGVLLAAPRLFGDRMYSKSWVVYASRTQSRVSSPSSFPASSASFALQDGLNEAEGSQDPQRLAAELIWGHRTRTERRLVFFWSPIALYGQNNYELTAEQIASIFSYYFRMIFKACPENYTVFMVKTSLLFGRAQIGLSWSADFRDGSSLALPEEVQWELNNLSWF